MFVKYTLASNSISVQRSIIKWEKEKERQKERKKERKKK